MRSIDTNTGDTELFLLRRAGSNGDFDHDCHIDMWDRAILENCFTGSDLGPPEGLLADCIRADFDEDGDVDHDDLAAFEASASGRNNFV